MEKTNRNFLVISLSVLFLTALIILAMISTARMTRKGYVGLVKVQGVILEDREVIKQLHKMNDNPLVKAIVMHINSPGGTLASAQSITKEMTKIRRGGKPIVISMAEVCASGGYYISCGADVVYANPASITGSIGVILRYPEAGNLLEKLGIRMEVVKSGQFKDMGDFSRKLNPQERQVMQTMIDDLHQQFIEKVLDARADKVAQAMAVQKKINVTNLPPEDVRKHIEQLADGRVFSGRQALTEGLVDKLGNLDDAVQTAAFLGKLKGTPKVIQERNPGIFKQLLRSSKNNQNGVLGFLLDVEFRSLLEKLLHAE